MRSPHVVIYAEPEGMLAAAEYASKTDAITAIEEEKKSDWHRTADAFYLYAGALGSNLRFVEKR